MWVIIISPIFYSIMYYSENYTEKIIKRQVLNISIVNGHVNKFLLTVTIIMPK